MAASPESRRIGFTLLEMSIVILISASMIVAAAGLFTNNLKQRQYDITNTRMAAIRAALYQYRVAFNSLPCPADPYLSGLTSANGYGLAAGSPGSCRPGGTPPFIFDHGQMPASVAVTFNAGIGSPFVLSSVVSGNPLLVNVGDNVATRRGICFGVTVVAVTASTVTISNHNSDCATTLPMTYFFHSPKVGGIISGVVPTKTLGLPDEYLFDGWGSRFSYNVVKDLTNIGAFSIPENITPTLQNPAMSRMTIKTGTRFTTTDATTEAIYVLLSYGPNKNHGRLRYSPMRSIEINELNADETENCDCRSTDVGASYYGDEPWDHDFIYVQKEENQDPANPSNVFDDIVIYETRTSMALKSSTAGSLGPYYTYKLGGGKPRQKALENGIFTLY